MPLSDEEVRRMAKERVGFRTHLGVYALVNAMLAVLWLLTSGGGYYWPVWTHFGWGVGLAFHGFNAYGPGSRASLEREAERIRRRHS